MKKTIQTITVEGKELHIAIYRREDKKNPYLYAQFEDKAVRELTGRKHGRERKIHSGESEQDVITILLNALARDYRDAVSKASAAVPDSFEKPYTGVFAGLPPREECFRDCNQLGWSMGTWRQAFSYLENAIAPRLDAIGLDISTDDLTSLKNDLVAGAVANGNYGGDEARARENLAQKLRRCTLLYLSLRNRYPALRGLPELNFELSYSRTANVEQCKALPEGVRVRLAALLLLLAGTELGGYAAAVGAMLFCGLRTAEAAALQIRDLRFYENYVTFDVEKQLTERLELTSLLKTENAYRHLVGPKIYRDLAAARLRFLKEHGYDTGPGSVLPISGDPKDPERFLSTGDISSAARKLLGLSGVNEAYMEDALRLMVNDADAVDGQKITDLAAYVLRRDFATRAGNVCGLSAAEQDYVLGHKQEKKLKWDHRSKDATDAMAAKLERYVFDPEHSAHPTFAPVCLTPGGSGELPLYTKLRLTAGDVPVTVELCIEAGESADAVSLETDGKLGKAAAFPVNDDAESRGSRPLIGGVRERAYYDNLIREVWENDVLKKAIEALGGAI